MIETKLTPFRGLYKLLGKSEDMLIAIGADATVKVQVGQIKMLIPIQIAIALGSKEAQSFLADPAIAAYLYASSERESRVYAANTLLNRDLNDKRRAFVAEVTAQGLASEQEAWVLAKVKFKG